MQNYNLSSTYQLSKLNSKEWQAPLRMDGTRKLNSYWLKVDKLTCGFRMTGTPTPKGAYIFFTSFSPQSSTGSTKKTGTDQETKERPS